MKTNKKLTKALSFFSVTLFLVLLFLIIHIAANAQLKKDNTTSVQQNQPKVKIQVNKQTDKNGNTIQYDSTYSWSWSGNVNVPENLDSIFQNMHGNFFGKSFFDNDSDFRMAFNLRNKMFNDSLFQFDDMGNFFGNSSMNINKMLQQQQKMMQEFFNDKPLFTVPNDAGKPYPKKEEKEIIKKEYYNPLL